jgi:hypothetical protein
MEHVECPQSLKVKVSLQTTQFPRLAVVAMLSSNDVLDVIGEERLRALRKATGRGLRRCARETADK